MDFKKFYYDYKNVYAPEERYCPILQVGDVVVVNFDAITDRDYTCHGKEELIYLINQYAINRKVLFVFEDGTNPHLTGAVELINFVIDSLKLNKSTCAVFAREPLSIDNATLIEESSILYWTESLHPHLKDVAIPTGPFSKKFAVWYNRGTLLRLKVVQQLVEKYRDDSFISYAEHGLLLHNKYNRYLEDDIAWAKTNTPIWYDDKWPADRVYNFELIVGAERKPYNEYFIEIVVETDTNSNKWMTEKTIKNLYVGKPFLLMTGAHALQRLRDNGFKTFSPWIDESYDLIENSHLRFLAIQQQIDQIGAMSYDDVNRMQQEMMTVFEHNRQVYEAHCTSR